MTFPTINHLNDLLPFIEGNKQFRVQKQDNGHTVVCYMVKDEDTFSGEHAFWYQECRGITFAPDGSVSSRTLHKFPNVGETAESQHSAIDWSRVVRVMDKRDGSMITPVLMENGEVRCKTKKTFTSAEAIEATHFLYDTSTGQYGLEWVKKMLLDGFTPVFEWTSPRFPIVLIYEKDELTLLHIRENATGRYIMNLGEGGRYTEDCPFPIVPNIIEEFMDAHMIMGCFAEDQVSWDLLRHMAETREGIEGVIVQLDDGSMFKIKTKWYCDLHHSVTFTRYRDVARSILLDQSDDLKAAFVLTGRSTAPIVELERIIFDKIKAAQSAVEFYVGFSRALERSVKDVALAFKDNDLFGQIMRTFRGQEVNWLEWYLKNHINDHSLEVIPQAGMDDVSEEVQ